MRVVVTGATGNLGTALVTRLLDADHEVVGIARRTPSAGDLAELVTWVPADLSRDACAPALRGAMRGADAVVHLAWGFQPSRRPDYLEELGVGGTRRVLAAASAAGVPHLVHLSSVGAYAPKRDDVPVEESYPTTGIPGSPYSRHKSAAERLLDRHEADGAGAPRVTRLRPGILGHRAAASALLRYGVPALVPGAALTRLPFVPLDRRLAIPAVHADDVAAAVALALDRTPGGAFNLMAEPPLGSHDLAAALGARAVHVPGRALRAAAWATWHARLQPLDPGWVDLAMQVPLLDTTRARVELGWTPVHTAEATLAELVAGLRDSASGPSPVLRPRSVARQLSERLRRGPITRRERP
ncbi:NAD-dependent epimerase/dehydratase family protein [Nocardioides marinquilinus]|uniref:NAD-dependent epimerase/dehydratase family protein n=1 Tax=Nocardioides marinquilinus TaxID=1210400 RepID=A0ABP9PHH7_9ACTN